MEADLYVGGLDRLGRPYAYKTDNVQHIHVWNGGRGYAYPPKVVIVGDGFGAEAVAEVDLRPFIQDPVYGEVPNPEFGSLTRIIITDRGMGYTETPLVELYGGFGLDRVLVQADANATGDNKLLYVDFYADGILWGRTKTKPYFIDWYPGQEGIHEVYTVARDDKGNQYTSDPLQVSIGFVEGPEIKLITPIGDLDSYSSFGVGGWPSFVAETNPGDAKIWKVEFQVDTMNRVDATWRGSSEDFLNNRWQYTWDPRGKDLIINTPDDNTYAGIPGKYKVRAIVTDQHLMVGLSEPEVFEISEIKGSQAPDNNMTFPVLFDKDMSAVQGSEPLVADEFAEATDEIELVTLTTESSYVFSTQAQDLDGSLRGVQYEVDGANVHFQFIDNPKDGDFLIVVNLDSNSSDQRPLLACVFRDMNQSLPYHPHRPESFSDLRNDWIDNLPKKDFGPVKSVVNGSKEFTFIDLPFFEVKIGEKLVDEEFYDDQDLLQSRKGTLSNLMNLLNDLSVDTDEDGFTDYRELILGTTSWDEYYESPQ